MGSHRSLSEGGLCGQYSFGDYTLDRRAGTLRCGDAGIDLRSKSFDVLVYLVERQGRLVEREELMQAVWPGVEVTDESVTRCIADIRKALSDDAQRLIRTVPRRGYLFAAPVAALIPEPPRPPAAGPEVVTRQPWRPRIKWIWAVLVPAFLVAGAFVGRSWRGREQAGTQRAVPLITLPGLARYPSLSPEGDRVAFAWTGPKQDNTDIYVQQIGAGSPLRLTTDAANDYNPVWSPDGRWIAFLRRDREDTSRSELRLIAPLGGVERKLAEIRVSNTYFLIPSYLGWCPDSHCLVVANSAVDGRGTALFAVSLDTGEQTQLTRFEGPGGDTNPAISPDGKWLVARTTALLDQKSGFARYWNPGNSEHRPGETAGRVAAPRLRASCRLPQRMAGAQARCVQTRPSARGFP
jgi:DNA-binding winged helix-turn-helix (wHTH) protein